MLSLYSSIGVATAAESFQTTLCDNSQPICHRLSDVPPPLHRPPRRRCKENDRSIDQFVLIERCYGRKTCTFVGRHQYRGVSSCLSVCVCLSVQRRSIEASILYGSINRTRGPGVMHRLWNVHRFSSATERAMSCPNSVRRRLDWLLKRR